MSLRIRTPQFKVPRKLFDEAVATYSGRLLWYEKIMPPIVWEDRQWVVTSMMLSHSYSWANLYEVVPLADWDGEVFVYGCYDEQWISEREKSGLFWHGVLVQTVDAPDQYVLSAKIKWTREKQPRSAKQGQVR